MRGMQVSVIGDMKAVLKDLTVLEKKTVPAATVAALNKTAKKVRTDGTREIAAQLQVKAKNIRRRIRTRRASRRYQVTTIRFLKAPISAVDEMTAGARQKGLERPGKRSGIKAGKHKFPHSFVGTGPGGNVHVFERVSKVRLPIEKRVISIEGAEEVLNKHVRRSGVHFRKLFEHELRWRIKKHGSR